jgi:hypothetical protein
VLSLAQVFLHQRLDQRHVRADFGHAAQVAALLGYQRPGHGHQVRWRLHGAEDRNGRGGRRRHGGLVGGCGRLRRPPWLRWIDNYLGHG